MRHWRAGRAVLHGLLCNCMARFPSPAWRPPPSLDAPSCDDPPCPCPRVRPVCTVPSAVPEACACLTCGTARFRRGLLRLDRLDARGRRGRQPLHPVTCSTRSAWELHGNTFHGKDGRVLLLVARQAHGGGSVHGASERASEQARLPPQSLACHQGSEGTPPWWRRGFSCSREEVGANLPKREVL